MTDQEIIGQFESCTLAKSDFSHANHVRVAFLYLQRFAIVEAIAEFSKGIRRLAASYGKADKYHETMTQAYMFIIHDRMSQNGMSGTWEEFASANLDLLKDGKSILEQYYRSATLVS